MSPVVAEIDFFPTVRVMGTCARNLGSRRLLADIDESNDALVRAHLQAVEHVDARDVRALPVHVRTHLAQLIRATEDPPTGETDPGDPL